jgi:hypothetical protein
MHGRIDDGDWGKKKVIRYPKRNHTKSLGFVICKRRVVCGTGAHGQCHGKIPEEELLAA